MCGRSLPFSEYPASVGLSFPDFPDTADEVVQGLAAEAPLITSTN